MWSDLKWSSCTPQRHYLVWPQVNLTTLFTVHLYSAPSIPPQQRWSSIWNNFIIVKVLFLCCLWGISGAKWKWNRYMTSCLKSCNILTTPYPYWQPALPHDTRCEEDSDWKSELFPFPVFVLNRSCQNNEYESISVKSDARKRRNWMFLCDLQNLSN